MLLNEQIQHTIQTFRDTLPAELNALIEIGAGEISSLPLREKALDVGDTAPLIELDNYDGATRSLPAYLVKGPVVLTFYRGLWCPYCNLQLAAFSRHLTEIRELGAELVAISPEGPDGMEVLSQSALPDEAKDMAVVEPGFDVLHDKNSVVSKQFGLTFTLPQSHQQLLQMMEVDIEKSTGDDTFSFADPATYIIGENGKIVWSFIPNNYRKRAEPLDVIAALKTLNGQKNG